MGWYFNKEIILPPGLREFEMGLKFNKEVILPKSLLYLKLGRAFSRVIDIPKRLISLNLLFCSPKTISINVFVFPHTLRKIIANRAFLNYDYIDNLPITVALILIYGLDKVSLSCNFATLLLDYKIKERVYA
jgi:hypothetical protein